MQAQNTYEQLLRDAEELLAKLKESDAPDIKRLRARVESAFFASKDAVTDPSKAAAKKIDELTQTAIEYIHDNPWIAVAAGIAIATAVVAISLTSRTKRN